jgi:hypothetical protein
VSKTGWGKRPTESLFMRCHMNGSETVLLPAILQTDGFRKVLPGWQKNLYFRICLEKAGEEFLSGRYKTIENDKPIIGRYGINEDGSSDGYVKGWALIHMIKTIMNDDEKFLKILRGLNTQFYHQVVTTEQIENYINRQSGINFNAVFDQYLRTSQIPVLEYFIADNKLQYRFTNCIDNFTMPIKITGIEDWLSPNTSWQSYDLNNTLINKVDIDPNFYIKAYKIKE